MKICFIAAANSVHSVRWINYFAQQGHEVHWISVCPWTFSVDERITKYALARAFPFAFPAVAGKVRCLIKEIAPDILHSHYAGVNGLLGTLSGFHPHLVTAWGSDVLLARASIVKRPLLKFILHRADLITCDAEHMRHAMEKLGLSSEKIERINFGIETDKFFRQDSDRKVREKYDLGDDPSVISLRNLEPIYDVETLMRAIPEILKNIPKAKFIIAGTGSQEQFLKSLASQLGVAGSIRFMGRYNHDILAKYLNAAHVYVSTSLSDAGISASTAEAMACELPVVITDSGENSLWVRNGENGFLVPVKEPDILAEKIVRLLKEEELRRQLGSLGRKIIQENNDYYNEMAKMGALYQQLSGKQ